MWKSKEVTWNRKPLLVFQRDIGNVSIRVFKNRQGVNRAQYTKSTGTVRVWKSFYPEAELLSLVKAMNRLDRIIVNIPGHMFGLS